MGLHCPSNADTNLALSQLSRGYRPSRPPFFLKFSKFNPMCRYKDGRVQSAECTFVRCQGYITFISISVAVRVMWFRYLNYPEEIFNVTSINVLQNWQMFILGHYEFFVCYWPIPWFMADLPFDLGYRPGFDTATAGLHRSRGPSI